jgi:hypothetical protein
MHLLDGLVPDRQPSGDQWDADTKSTKALATTDQQIEEDEPAHNLACKSNRLTSSPRAVDSRAYHVNNDKDNGKELTKISCNRAEECIYATTTANDDRPCKDHPLTLWPLESWLDGWLTEF